MPARKRFKTQYPGVSYTKGKTLSRGKEERIYNIRYRKNGKQVEEKAGRTSEGMTPARASIIRSERMAGKRLSNKERREVAEQQKIEDAELWTIGRLWDSYRAGRPENKTFATDRGRYEKYLRDVFADKEPKDLDSMAMDRFRFRLLKKLSPQTVKHILNLLTWIINHGVNNGYCTGAPFKIKKPSVDNKKTEFLNDEQLKRLLVVLDEHSNVQVANMMKLVLATGIRRGGLLDLQWRNIDFERGFITLRNKGGKDEILPMNDMARAILKEHPRGESIYVFPGKDGTKRSTVAKAARGIANEAGLPKDFRPLHGLRHHFASTLASSGKVDLFLIQKLLLHKNPVTTQRYSHLRDEALKDASQVAGDIINGAMQGKAKKKVVNIR